MIVVAFQSRLDSLKLRHYVNSIWVCRGELFKLEISPAAVPLYNLLTQSRDTVPLLYAVRWGDWSDGWPCSVPCCCWWSACCWTTAFPMSSPQLTQQRQLIASSTKVFNNSYTRVYLFCIFFGGLDCVGHSLAYVAHCVFLRDVWMRCKQARYQLSHPSPYFPTHLPT
jgi:hypothetical protein